MSTVESMSTTERFLQYVAFDTQSVRESTTAPSAEKELALAAFLVDELKALGVEDARIGEGGYNIIHNNCEHLAYECVFGEKKSEQTDAIRAFWREKFNKEV